VTLTISWLELTEQSGDGQTQCGWGNALSEANQKLFIAFYFISYTSWHIVR